MCAKGEADGHAQRHHAVRCGHDHGDEKQDHFSDLEHGDRVLGTDFRFDRLSLSLEVVYSIVRGTQLGLDVLAGQVDGTAVPSQRLFDVGGEGTVRGVEASRFVEVALDAAAELHISFESSPDHAS